MRRATITKVSSGRWSPASRWLAGIAVIVLAASATSTGAESEPGKQTTPTRAAELPGNAPRPMESAPAAGSSGKAMPGAVGEALTPEAAVSLALAYNPQLQAARTDQAAADAERRVARSGYLPRLDLTEDLVRSTNPVFVFASKLGQENFGPQDFAISSLNQPDAYTNAATRVILRQNVWDGGRTILGRKAAKLGVTAADESTARSAEETAFGALRAFWDAALSEEMLSVARAGEAAAQANRDVAARQVEVGMAVPSDLMSADVRLSEVKAMRIRAEQGTTVARAAIRQALGLSEDREYSLAVPKVEAVPPADDAESRVIEALVARPDLRALDRRLEQAGVGEDIARSRFYPEIGVGAQYEWNSKTAFGSTGDNWTVGASLRVPLFEGLEHAARIDRAKADREKLAAMRRAMEEGIRLEVRAAHADAVSAAERLKVAESAAGQAEEALRIVRERYEEGMAVMVELLGAEAASTAAKGNRAAAARDLALARAALDLSSGRTLLPEEASPAAGAEDLGRSTGFRDEAKSAPTAAPVSTNRTMAPAAAPRAEECPWGGC